MPLFTDVGSDMLDGTPAAFADGSDTCRDIGANTGAVEACEGSVFSIDSLAGSVKMNDCSSALPAVKGWFDMSVKGLSDLGIPSDAMLVFDSKKGEPEEYRWLFAARRRSSTYKSSFAKIF
eukprot:jgi/Hompol1/159/HPOL_002136-RA